MIAVDKAFEILKENKILGPVVQIEVDEALGFVLAEDVFSPIDMPPFDQSAMDGYALGDAFSDSYTVIGEVKAGESAEDCVLKSGEAVRIFTGAMVPASAASVIKQESISRIENTITITDKNNEGENIRRRGEQIKENQVALEKGTQINAGTIGFLIGLGVTSIAVYSKPKIQVIVTGNELVAKGEQLTMGKIFESNSYTLIAALKEVGIAVEVQTVKDDYESTVRCIENALSQNDLVLMTGGISVGDYDFVGKAFNALEVEQLFYKIKQKPGKPIYFGRKNEKFVFGLPGNPAATLSCFYLYVLPWINQFLGKANSSLVKRNFRLLSSYTKTPKMTHFLKAHYDGEEVTILGQQSSAMLSAFSSANCLLFMEEGKSEFNAGDSVEGYILP